MPQLRLDNDPWQLPHPLDSSKIKSCSLLDQMLSCTRSMMKMEQWRHRPTRWWNSRARRQRADSDTENHRRSLDVGKSMSLLLPLFQTNSRNGRRGQSSFYPAHVICHRPGSDKGPLHGGGAGLDKQSMGALMTPLAFDCIWKSLARRANRRGGGGMQYFHKQLSHFILQCLWSRSFVSLVFEQKS